MAWYSVYLLLLVVTLLKRFDVKRKSALKKPLDIDTKELKKRIKQGEKLLIYEGLVIDVGIILVAPKHLQLTLAKTAL